MKPIEQPGWDNDNLLSTDLLVTEQENFQLNKLEMEQVPIRGRRPGPKKTHSK